MEREFTGPALWSGGTGKRSVQAKGGTGRASVSDGGVDATDAAKAFAAEQNVDLSTVTGTGTDGRVTKDDVQAAIEQNDEGDQGILTTPEPEPVPDEADTTVTATEPA